MFFPIQRQLIKKAFNARLFTWYGQSEQVVLAGECEESEVYHIYPQYGITELVDEYESIITKDGVEGEIVGTGFNNYAMPFIRYKTGDIATFYEKKCSCGRNYKTFNKIEGRSDDYIYTMDGRKVSLTALIFGQHFEAFEQIKKMQLYQENNGEIEIRIVKNKGFNEIHENEIRHTIFRAVNSGLVLKFRYIDEIPLTKAGKHKFLVKKLS